MFFLWFFENNLKKNDTINSLSCKAVVIFCREVPKKIFLCLWLFGGVRFSFNNINYNYYINLFYLFYNVWALLNPK